MRKWEDGDPKAVGLCYGSWAGQYAPEDDTNDGEWCLQQFTNKQELSHCSKQYMGMATANNGDRNCRCFENKGGTCRKCTCQKDSDDVVMAGSIYKQTWPSCNADLGLVLGENCECAPGYQGLITLKSGNVDTRDCIARESYSGRLLENSYAISLAVYDWLFLLISALIY